MKIVDSLIKNYNCTLLRYDDDIDMALLDVSQYDAIIKFMQKKGFIFTKMDQKLNFKKFEDQKLIDIDISLNLNDNYLTQFFYDISIDEKIQQQYFRNPQKYGHIINSLRYILLLRGREEKYINFLLHNKNNLLEYKFYLNYLNKSPFKKEFKNFEDFIKVIKREKIYMLKYIKLQYILKIYINKFRKKRGKLIAFLGIDGSGKTTVIDILSRELKIKRYYLGDRSLKFTKIYSNAMFKPFSIIMQYIEKFIRVFWLKLITFNNKNILLDRYYFYMVSKNDHFIKKKLYTFLYNKLFIKPSITYVLWNEAEVILQRKQEVSKKEIIAFNKDIPLLPFSNVVKIKNDNLDETLNNILKDIIK